MHGTFYVEHLVNASLMAKHELSANDTCALSESKLKAQLELSANDTCALKEDELKAKYEFSAAGNMQINISKNKGG